MSAIIIRDLDGNVVHRMDTTGKSERQRERAFAAVLMKTDTDRFTVDEED